MIFKGLSLGWDNAGPETKAEDAPKLLPHLLDAIRKGNHSGDLTSLRDDWPLSYHSLIPLLNGNGQSIPKIALLDDGRITARIGTHYEAGKVVVVVIDQLSVTTLDGIEYFGKSRNKKYFAYASENGISVTEGWLGKETVACAYPTGREGLPAEFQIENIELPTKPTKMILFPDGQRVLFIRAEGIFVLSDNEEIRLMPSEESYREHFTWLLEEYPGDDLNLELTMEHGAISVR